MRYDAYLIKQALASAGDELSLALELDRAKQKEVSEKVRQLEKLHALKGVAENDPLVRALGLGSLGGVLGAVPGILLGGVKGGLLGAGAGAGLMGLAGYGHSSRARDRLEEAGQGADVAGAPAQEKLQGLARRLAAG